MTTAKSDMASLASQASSTQPELFITRVLNAPRSLVWQALTEPDRLMQWWGPKGLAMRVAKVDLCPGSVFHYSLQAGNGSEMWGRFVYQEIVAPERLVFINSFSDAQGGITRHPMAPNWPLELLNVWTLSEQDGKTTLTMRGEPYHATAAEQEAFVAAIKSVEQGTAGTFDQLDEYLAQVQ